jgi:hypothetical protein
MENDTSILFFAFLLQASLTIPFWWLLTAAVAAGIVARKAGYSQFWGVLVLVLVPVLSGVVLILGIWILAWMKWPSESA